MKEMSDAEFERCKLVVMHWCLLAPATTRKRDHTAAARKLRLADILPEHVMQEQARLIPAPEGEILNDTDLDNMEADAEAPAAAAGLDADSETDSEKESAVEPAAAEAAEIGGVIEAEPAAAELGPRGCPGVKLQDVHEAYQLVLKTIRGRKTLDDWNSERENRKKKKTPIIK